MKGNAQADASWLLYRLHPQVQVQSTWEYVAGQTTMAALQAWDRGPAELPVHVDAFGVNVLVLNTGRSWPGIAALQAGGWGIVHLEDQWLVMIREPLARPALTYHLICPWMNAPVTPGNASRVLQEATRALPSCPDGATFAWAYQLEALRLLGRYEESFEARLKIPEKLVIECAKGLMPLSACSVGSTSAVYASRTYGSVTAGSHWQHHRDWIPR
jgi:hypothetical protein